MTAEEGIRQLLIDIGEDANRDGLIETPKRVVKAITEMTKGITQDPQQILNKTFKCDNDEMVSVINMPFVSLCEHHIMPFWGKCSIAYIPSNGKVIGVSKIARLLQCYAQRLQIQETMTRQIATMLYNTLQPKGVGVIITAEHSCMKFRGIKNDGMMRTSCLLGVFLNEPATRAEFLSLVSNGK